MKAILGMFVAAVCGKMMVERDMIEHINSVQKLWVAKENPISRLSPEEARGLAGTTKLEASELDLPRLSYANKGKLTAPESFDSRTQWPDCKVMKQIRDQKSCGSCWAFSVVEAITDRECIVNGINSPRSSQDVLSCSKGLLGF